MNNTKSLMSQVTIRDRQQLDDNFIISSWASSYRNHPTFGAMPEKLYFTHINKFIIRVLGKSYGFIACDSRDKSVIFGYCIYRFHGDLPIVSYVYVKEHFRRFGIAATLIKQVSSETKIITALIPKHEKWLKALDCVFDPFLEY